MENKPTKEELAREYAETMWLEIIRPIPGTKTNYCTPLGEVYNAKPSGLMRLTKSEDKDGYYKFSCKINGKIKSMRVSRAVLLTFLGDPSFDDATCDHIDGDKKNNDIKNLRWVSREENTRLRWETGIRCDGENNGRSKLTSKQVRSIRKKYLRFCRINGSGALAKKYGVCDSTILRVVNGEIWKKT